MKKKGIAILAVCVLLLGLLSVNGTLANAVDKIFRIISGDQPEQNEQLLQVKLVNEAFDIQNKKLVPQNALPIISPAYYPDGYDWESDKVKTTIDGVVYYLWDDQLRTPVDKVVSVQNTSNDENEAKDAYFRVAIAVDANIFGLLKINFNKADDRYLWEENWTDITAKGRAYKMMVATYTDALEPGKKSPPFMLQVAMDKNATNEDYAKIDSNFILITAMAVDADALKDKNDENAVRPGAIETLDAAVPVDSQLNPF